MTPTPAELAREQERRPELTPLQCRRNVIDRAKLRERRMKP
jgi:hypothetical protein